MNWKQILHLLHILNLRFDPQFAPPGPRKAKVKTTGNDQAQDPDNLLYTSVTATAYTSDGTDDNPEWNKYDGPDSGRSAVLTDSDRTVITSWHLTGENRPKLSEAKYMAVKVKWARNLSAAKASRELTKERGHGYKIRTVENYYTAINYADTLPHRVKRGLAPQSTAKEVA